MSDLAVDLQPQASSQLGFPQNLLLDIEPGSRSMHEHVASEGSAKLGVGDPPFDTST